MDLFGSELDLIENLQDYEISEVLPLPEDSKEAKEIFQLIHNPQKWKNWIDSSGKGDLPPDFYSDKYKVMLEVMRIDDHGFVSKKGKIVNPTLSRESEIKKELKSLGVLDRFPNAKLHINADTGLSTTEDHNYGYYLANFKRVAENHNLKVNEYKNNHPNYKLVFYIFDESSAYIENIDNTKNLRAGDICAGCPHLWFMDKEFLNVINKLSVDFLIWCTPYKLIRTIDGILGLPKIVVYDIKAINKLKSIEYKKENLTSIEE